MADEVTSDSVEDKVSPTVSYVQKLGPDHLDLIFTASSWVFSLSPKEGLEIFIADMEEVERLPRHAVSNYLSKIASKEEQIKYLEHIIEDLDEKGPEFHERLIELYLERVRSSSSSSSLTAVGGELDQETGDKDDHENAKTSQEADYKKLIRFLENSTQYRPDRLLGRIGEDEKMQEVKATLLGKLGQHDGALQIYVHKLQDHQRAEEWVLIPFSVSKAPWTRVLTLNVATLQILQAGV
jgi:tetratricopeptide (TPR) repeat protein